MHAGSIITMHASSIHRLTSGLHQLQRLVSGHTMQSVISHPVSLSQSLVYYANKLFTTALQLTCSTNPFHRTLSASFLSVNPVIVPDLELVLGDIAVCAIVYHLHYCINLYDYCKSAPRFDYFSYCFSCIHSL